MKKKILLMMVLICTSLAFVSCSSNDDNEPIYGDSPIVGVWSVSGSTNQGISVTTTYIFNANGTGSVTNRILGETETENFVYTYDSTAKTIILRDDDDYGSITLTNVAITTKTLTFTLAGTVVVLNKVG